MYDTRVEGMLYITTNNNVLLWIIPFNPESLLSEMFNRLSDIMVC